MNRISLALVGAVFVARAAMAPAYAATDYTWTFTANGFDAHGTLMTDSGPDVAGNIVDITGSISGETITGVVPTSATNTLFTFDNKLDPNGDRFVDSPGLLFTTESGTEYNLYAVFFPKPQFASSSNNDPAGPGGYNLDAANANGYGDSINGEFSIALASSAPEPAYWILMLAGFTILGFMLRMQSKVGSPAI